MFVAYNGVQGRHHAQISCVDIGVRRAQQAFGTRQTTSVPRVCPDTPPRRSRFVTADYSKNRASCGRAQSASARGIPLLEPSQTRHSPLTQSASDGVVGPGAETTAGYLRTLTARVRWLRQADRHVQTARQRTKLVPLLLVSLRGSVPRPVVSLRSQESITMKGQTKRMALVVLETRAVWPSWLTCLKATAGSAPLTRVIAQREEERHGDFYERARAESASLAAQGFDIEVFVVACNSRCDADVLQARARAVDAVLRLDQVSGGVWITADRDRQVRAHTALARFVADLGHRHATTSIRLRIGRSAPATLTGRYRSVA